MTTDSFPSLTIGVLALQGAFAEHLQLLRLAAAHSFPTRDFNFVEVRTEKELNSLDALVIPGGESTTISLVAQRSGLLEPLRDFVKLKRRPTWGTCAGLILLAESANRTKKGGQELIGGLDVRVNRNHFGRQIESFQADIELPLLNRPASQIQEPPFRAIFIRAPIVEKILPTVSGVQESEACREETVVAPSKATAASGEVQVMATLPGRAAALEGDEHTKGVLDVEAGDIIAVRQGNCFGTSFHPELTGDERVHAWWLGEVLSMTEERQAR